MMLFNITNALLAWIASGIIIGVLLGNTERIGTMQRLGLGLMGAGFLLSTPPLFFHNTPFDVWSFSITRAGVTLYLVATYGQKLLEYWYPTPRTRR